ncbi:MAG: hypothetical protein ACFFD5_01650 [Candidatus Thorarchaeota archaeon]
MNEKQNNHLDQEETKKFENDSKDQDDLKDYLTEIKDLKSDFSDLDDLDFEELKEMQDAIIKVREMENLEVKKTIKDTSLSNNSSVVTEKAKMDEYLAQKEALISDFSDLDEFEFEELKEIQEAIETVKQEELQLDSEQLSDNRQASSISSELEERIKQELLERKEEKEVEIITPEKFIEYAKNKRDKIWYHALYYIVFQTEDYVASKELLYEMLKEVTSKSPIDPIPEHQFYFGLGYILRLTLNEKQIVRFLSGSKFKINVGIKVLTEILEQIGEPISTRPIIKEEEKQKMFKDFLEDDFSDI